MDEGGQISKLRGFGGDAGSKVQPQTHANAALLSQLACRFDTMLGMACGVTQVFMHLVRVYVYARSHSMTRVNVKRVFTQASIHADAYIFTNTYAHIPYVTVSVCSYVYSRIRHATRINNILTIYVTMIVL